MKKLVVIKLGGSALTDKSRAYTARPATIQRIAREIAVAKRKTDLVIIHGAGSFGHIPVKHYGLQNGFQNPRQLFGLASTKLKLLEWEGILDTIFLQHGVNIVPFFASDLAELKAGRINRADINALRRWLALGCVPIIGGDIVPDIKRGFSILSGDQLAAYLAITLKAARLVFGIDVDGIFDSDPKMNRNAKLLTELDPTTARQYAARVTVGEVPDVTGGMAGKISESIVAAKRGVTTYFVNLNKRDRLKRAALGQTVLGSRLRA
ncbi:MAG TPA: isopentenyl phosphate kinase [Terriglobales bacterium]|nr:isopentenyl phosphate kinase [Terriglobales bacterium]